jgi:hypothetical protein
VARSPWVMIPQPMLHLPELERWVSDAMETEAGPGVRCLGQKTTRMIAHLNVAFFRRRPHRDLVAATEVNRACGRERDVLYQAFNASSFTAKRLRNDFGGSTAGYKRLMRGFFDFDERGGRAG